LKRANPSFARPLGKTETMIRESMSSIGKTTGKSSSPATTNTPALRLPREQSARRARRARVNRTRSLPARVARRQVSPMRYPRSRPTRLTSSHQ
jgi:hypothetical protein